MNNFCKKQQGMSLIGLMIGMLLGVVSIVAATSMYHSMVEVAIDTTIAAKHDAELVTGLSTLQMELVNAGYGIPSAKASEQLLKVSDTELNWRYYDDGVWVCRALMYDTSNDRAILKLLNATTCANGTDFSGVTGWEDLAVLAEFDVINNTVPPAIKIESAGTADCYPFGRGTSGTYGSVTISAESAASRATRAAVVPIAKSNFTICLPNLS